MRALAIQVVIVGLILLGVVAIGISQPHDTQVTMAPPSDRAAIAVWCAQHAKAPTPTDRRAFIASCTETNTP